MSHRAPAAVGHEIIEGPGHHQPLRRLELQADAPHQVGGSGVGAIPLPLLHDELRRLRAHVPDEPQAQQNRILPRDTVHYAAVDAGIQEGHAETPGVLLQSLHRVEAHGLLVDQGCEEIHRMVAFQPGDLVRGHGEGGE